MILPARSDAVMYIKSGVSLIGEKTLAPTVSLGSRHSLGSLFALDFSWGLAAAKEKKVAMYTSPRIAALAYINPWSKHRVYVGGAGSWAIMGDARRKHLYSGAMVEAVAGIEWGSICYIHPFIEVAQAFPCKKFSSRVGSLGRHPTTTIMIGLGI